jgi:ParB-like chromosome segregation protein Spo0J
MLQLRIADIFANSLIDPESHLDDERVKRYAQMLDALPPVVVFDTSEGLLLADGYHRVTAARQRGLETVKAEVRRGTRHDTLTYAAKVAAAQQGISPEDAAAYIRRRSQSQGSSTL